MAIVSTTWRGRNGLAYQEVCCRTPCTASGGNKGRTLTAGGPYFGPTRSATPFDEEPSFPVETRRWASQANLAYNFDIRKTYRSGYGSPDACSPEVFSSDFVRHPYIFRTMTVIRVNVSDRNSIEPTKGSLACTPTN